MSTYLKIADVQKGPEEMPQDPPINYTFPLDPFQQHAMKAICSEENVLVTAKTGSGKTLVGEIQIAYSLRKGKRVFYTTPIKSLSNQKFKDLKKQFGSVGIMTGDIKFCPDAKVVIMTTEILRNLLFKKDSTTKEIGLTAEISCADLDAVIFDECHYINDRDRGHVWEEVMILLPPEVKMIMLSATLDHPEYFAEWLGELKQRSINLISTEYRIVPLTHTLWYAKESHVLMDAKNNYNDKTYRDWIDWLYKQDLAHTKFQEKVRDARAGGTEGAISGKIKPTSFLYRMNGLITHLQEKELLPALFFVLSRKDCEKYAKKVEGTLITSSEVADVRHVWNFHLRNHRAKLEVLPQYHLLFELVQRGIAFHHSGIIPTLKEIVEILFGKGLIKVLFATETFAVGINMPTKTAVFVGLKKYDEQRQGMRMLNTAEYLQMAGRAGRRGLDTMGTVIYLPDRDPVEPSEMRAMMCGGKAPVESRMEFGYDFILKTIQSGNRNWLDLLNKTYWRRQREAVIQDLRVEQDKLLSKKQQIPISDSEMDVFSEKVSIEEEIRNTTNAKRKKAELALRKWKEEHMGHRWTMLEENYKEVKGLERLLQNIEKDLASALDVSSSVEARIRVLEDTGFLKHLDDPIAHTKDSLTTQGILATELNEADPILISQFYLSPHSMNVSPKDLLVTLAACITEGKKGDTETSVKELDVSKDVKDAIYEIGDVWNNMRVSENKMGAKASDWNLSTFWMEIMNRWMDGEAISVICEEYGVYEGNLIRSVLKLQNMLDEWRSMASFCQHTEMIKKLEETHLLLVRDAVIQDSLYLHL
ncbi:MAG: DEAD/DEAH box helicase [Bacteroidetes bacterium]|nr:DEAD/DEAH box helicase [bacterium]NBP65639.1 DEAD/DEAH box helicase [Bacteroidota bacterium]